MKKIFLSLLFLISAFASFGQQGAQALSGVFFRVQDTVAYQAAAATRHSQGYKDIYFNDQATTKHWDIWNGSSYDHVFDFNAGGGGSSTTRNKLPPVYHVNDFTLVPGDTSRMLILEDNVSTVTLGDFSTGVDGSQFVLHNSQDAVVTIDPDGQQYLGSLTISDSTFSYIYFANDTFRISSSGSNGGGGSGDVVGPASSTDGAPALFDGTTGKLLKNSTPTGTGNPVLATSPTLVTPALGTPSALTLTNATGLPPTTGISGWPANASGYLQNNGSGTLSWGNPNANAWLLASGGTLTGVNTITSFSTNGVIFNGSHTATANNQYGISYQYNLTTRNTNNDALFAIDWSPTLNVNGGGPTGQILAVAQVNPTFSGTASKYVVYQVNTNFTPWYFAGTTFTPASQGYTLLTSQGYGVRMNTSSSSLEFASQDASIYHSGSNANTIRVGQQVSNAASARTFVTWDLVLSTTTDHTPTSGTDIQWKLQTSGRGTFAPTSGTATWTSFQIAPTINQTSTASGAITYFDINPTRTGVLGAEYAITARAGLSSFAHATPLSTVDVDGSLGLDITSTSTDITANTTHHTILVDASGAARTITLPAASGATRRVYRIKKTDASANSVTIDGNSSETIDGVTTKATTTQYAGWVIQCDGSNWHIIGTISPAP